MPWECFLIEAVDYATTYVVGCPAKHRVELETLRGVRFDEAPAEPPAGWPAACPECELVMTYDAEGDDAAWNTRIGHRIYRRPDTGEESRWVHEFGAGAMFDASDWQPWQSGPDGRVLGVVLPPAGQADIWIIDSEASSGGRWTRSGEPPNITASPSILTPNYHGFLQDGVLTDSLPDRPLP